MSPVIFQSWDASVFLVCYLERIPAACRTEAWGLRGNDLPVGGKEPRDQFETSKCGNYRALSALDAH